MGSIYCPIPPLTPHPASWLWNISHSAISDALDFTVVNYSQKLPANLALISAAGGTRVDHTQYTHLAGLFWVLWQNLQPVAHNQERPHITPYLSLIYISTCQLCDLVARFLVYTSTKTTCPARYIDYVCFTGAGYCEAVPGHAGRERHQRRISHYQVSFFSLFSTT